MKRTIILASISVLCLLQVGWGQIPQTISYQGVLKDAGGNLLDGSYNLAFSLYDVATEGTELWSSETYLNFEVTAGIFHVILGSSKSFDLDFDAQYWLEITINGGPLSPRTKLTAVPYSLASQSVAGGTNIFPATGNVGIGTTNPAKKLEVGGTVQLRGHPDSTGLYVDVDGSVGIGTQGLPMSALEVAGNITATAFSGDGSGLTNLSASGWSLTGNSGTDGGASNFLGTTDDQALELHVNKARALRLEPNAMSPNVIGGHIENIVAPGVYGATIGGGGTSGYVNQVTAPYAAIGGGYSNTASGSNAAIGGGSHNTASGGYATIPGGYYNVAAGGYSFATGSRAKANHGGAFVWADATVADFASTAANEFAVRATGGFRFLTSTDGSGLRLEPHAMSPNVIGGHIENIVAPGVYGATIGGGGTSGYVNQVTAPYATIGGGYSNTASGGNAAIGGGNFNTASSEYATIPGGYYNVTAGGYSFAAGYKAKANNHGCFVWADSTNADFGSTVEDQFLVRASGGTKIYSNAAATTGVTLATGGNSWGVLSDRNAKENFRDEDGEEVLTAVATMPIQSWNYKSQDPSIRHLGPMAQDFYTAFGLGEDEKYINTVDIDGINLLAIQALDKRTRELKEAFQNLDEKTQQIEAQAREIEALQAAVAALRLSSGQALEARVKVAARE